jgi:hypothetical protein
VTEGGVCNKGNVKRASGGDEVVGFMEGFEGGVFGLYGVDFGDYSFTVLVLQLTLTD